MALKASRYLVASGPFLDELDGQRKRVVYATRSGEVRIFNEAAWSGLTTNEISGLPSEVVDELSRASFVVPEDEDELAAVLGENTRAARDNKTLVMVIQPTASCQLGCAYCGQKHTADRLSPDHQDAIVGRVNTKLATGQFRHLQVRWFGGEPLSAMPQLRILSRRLQELATQHAATYSSLIVTNGLTLNRKIAAELVQAHKVRSFHITLDGAEAYHDRRRTLKKGGATFERIFENLAGLTKVADAECDIRVRANVDQYNYEGISPLLRNLAEAGIQDRIEFYVSPIYSWGNEAQERSLEPEDFASLEIRWFTEMQQLGFRVSLVPSPRRIVCFAVDPNAELVDAMGNIFNCTETPYVPAYGEPNKFAIGHVSTGVNEEKRDALGSFNTLVAEGSYPCTDCNMLPVCGGACPKAWLEGHRPCPSAKWNIESRLLLSYAASRINGDGAMQ
jgi:uncharacterized protein